MQKHKELQQIQQKPVKNQLSTTPFIAQGKVSYEASHLWAQKTIVDGENRKDKVKVSGQTVKSIKPITHPINQLQQHCKNPRPKLKD